jgi:outer membrane protein assembly factor BamD
MPKFVRVFVPALLIGLLVAEAAQAQWVWTPQTGRWINMKRLPRETPELQLEYARSLLLDGDYNKALRECDKFDKFYGDSELSDQVQYLRGEIRLGQGKHMAAAQAFQQVLSAYPDTSLYDDAIDKQYEVADHYYDVGERRMDDRWRPFRKRPLKKAIEVYEMVIENQPFTETAAEAQYKVGLCHYTREEYIESAFEYRRVVEDYSGSEWVDDASYGLAQTYYDMSFPPEYDQTPSMLAIEAIDDFTSRFPSDERTTGMDEKRAEMRNRIAEQRLQTAAFYEKRRKFESARIYYEIIIEDFSDTPAAETAKAWLAEHTGVESLTEKYQDKGYSL